MDFSKLSSNERLAAYGALASIVGGLLTIFSYAAGSGLILTLLLGIAMLAIVFMPQWSPTTKLPGSKGSLMLVVGGVAAVGALLGLLALLSLFALLAGYAGFVLIPLIALILGVVGGFMMGWAGWQEFQAEGGKFQIGTQGASSAPASSAPPAAPAQSAPPAAPAPTQAPPPAAPPASSDTDDSMPS